MSQLLDNSEHVDTVSTSSRFFRRTNNRWSNFVIQLESFSTAFSTSEADNGSSELIAAK